MSLLVTTAPFVVSLKESHAAELHPFAEVVDADRVGADPPFDYHDYVVYRRAPKEPCCLIIRPP